MARKPVDPELKRKKVQAYVRPDDYDWIKEVVGDEPGKRWQSQSEMWDVGMRLLRAYHEEAGEFEHSTARSVIRAERS